MPLSMLEHAHRVVHLAHPDMPCTCDAFVPRAWAKTGRQFSLSAGYSMYRLAMELCILHLASAADYSAHRLERQADPPTTLPSAVSQHCPHAEVIAVLVLQGLHCTAVPC